MQLLAPLGLLASVVIPAIIILYMLKKRTRPQVVSSIMLWQRLDRVNRPALKLSKLLRSLLLFLQLATALLLVLALARPALNLLGGSGTLRVVILDTSVAMGVREKGQTRLEEALALVRAQVRAKAPGDKMALIAMGEEALLVSGFSADSAALLAALSQVAVDSARANPDAALALAANMAAAEEGAQVQLYSAGCFSTLARQPAGDFQFIALGQEQVVNLMLESMVPDGDRLYVTVFNNGAAAATTRVEVRDARGELAGLREVELAPRERQVLVWRNLPQSQWFLASLSGSEDQLALDNDYYALSAKNTADRLLLVSQGNLFLERALLLYPGISLSRVAPEDYTAAMADSYDLFVFDGFLPPELPGHPLLIFDPPHPNPHFGTGPAVAIKALRPLPHPLMNHVDFSEVSIGFGKALQGGSGLLEFEQGLLAVSMERQGQPLVVFGFAVQAGDLPLRPAFPILLRNILADFAGGGGPVIPLKYGRKVPGGQVAVLGPKGETLAPGQTLGAGVHTLVTAQGQELVAVNPPATTDSLAARQALETTAGRVQGQQAAKGMPLVWPLILAALILTGLEWWVDNYGS